MKVIVLIRDFITDVTNSVITVIRVLLLSKFFLNKITKDPNTNEVVILGNGPSLSKFLESQKGLMNSKSVFCVNNFARTKEYTEIKPTHYVICSPEHFLVDQKEEFHNDRKITFKAIAEQTTWKMQLIVPSLAKNKKVWKKEIAKNTEISIKYMNTTPVEGFKALTHFFFSRGMGMPRPHNVLIPSIYLALRLRFSKVFLAGTDHSWLKEIVVTGENEVLLSQKHFYDKQTENEKIEKNKPSLQPMYKGVSTDKRRLHEVLEKFYISFKSYWTLRRYADSKGIEVVNMTKESYIDAFNKPTS